MEENKEFAEAWSKEDSEGRRDDPIVESVKAARKAEDDEFADAFKSDKFKKDKDK